MEKKIYTPDELNNASRDELVGIILSLQQTEARMMENQELILEQTAILRQQMKRRSLDLKKLSSAGRNGKKESAKTT